MEGMLKAWVNEVSVEVKYGVVWIDGDETEHEMCNFYLPIPCTASSLALLSPQSLLFFPFISLSMTL
uniref:Uncharacterized protein n=1 Tax=Solanum tuberosum TaxID=4113 RepID=M1BK74_SOLTU